MSKTVAHFIRKSSQLKASFINNQISNHINYKPVIIYRYQSQRDDGGFAEFNKKDIPTLDLSEGELLNINYRYLKKISSRDTKRVIAFLKRHNVSILHFHYGSDAYIYSDVMKQAGRPSVVSFYGYDASSFQSSLHGYGYILLQKVFKNGTKMLAMSPDMKKDLLSTGCPEDKIIVHYYGSDVNKFYIARHFSNKKTINFLIISGIEPQKGHVFLLKAFKEAFSIKGNIKLNIYGTGSIESEITRFISVNNMGGYVEFNGKVTYASPEHINILNNADVFIHTSVIAANGDKEGIPGAIVEAMAAGLPVISTHHAGIPYIIKDNETGLLVKEWDVDGLAKAIIHLAENPELRRKLGLAAQKYAIEHLDLKEKEKDLENVYNSLL